MSDEKESVASRLWRDRAQIADSGAIRTGIPI
jgi:hypothetical protein